MIPYIPPPPEAQAVLAQMPSLTPACVLTLLAIMCGALCLIRRIHGLPVAADLAILSAARQSRPTEPIRHAPAVWVPHQLREDSYRDDTGSSAEAQR